MKILVTGSAGFIGQGVVRHLLDRGHTVLALTRSSRSTQWNHFANLEVLEHDLVSENPLPLSDRGIEIVIHLAASVSGDAAAQRRNTVTGTVNLLEAASRAGISRMIAVSTIAVLDYISLPHRSLIDERVGTVSSAETLGAYASAKLTQEKIVIDFGQMPGRNCIILRPGLVYGGSRLSAAHAGFIKGRVGLLSLHDGEVPLIEVQGLCRAIADAVEVRSPGCEVVHLVDDYLPTQATYLSELRLRGLLPKIEIGVPMRVLKSFSRLLHAGLSLGHFEQELPEVLTPHGFSSRLSPFRFSNEKAKRFLGWTPGRAFEQ